jgi:hypothetical protein
MVRFSNPSDLPVFHLDKSRIPTEKLDDPELAKWEEAIRIGMQDGTYRMKVCLHEAAHAIYIERAGGQAILHLPVAFYDARDDTFDVGGAAVAAHFEKEVAVDGLVMARWYVAGGVAQQSLISGCTEAEDEQDFEVFSAQWQSQGLPPQEMLSYWEQAKLDVEKDLRSPAFRAQILERARQMEQQLLEMASKNPTDS